MSSMILVADSYFDGERHHPEGPFTIEIVTGKIAQVLQGDLSSALTTRHCHLHGEARPVIRASFVMPGLVEAHAHLFLDGAELDAEVRKKYLRAGRDEMLAMGRSNVRALHDAGITLVRDAGDIHGINSELKADAAGPRGRGLEILSAGRGMRKTGRYGSFMAVEVADAQSIARTIRELAASADQLKILLTGIIDFETGQMKGGPQFDLEETQLIVRTAHDLGLRTFAHCSGLDGLKIAVAAGIDSIEHGFFMNRDVLEIMAEKAIAWVPTFSPVFFQFQHPEHGGWGAAAVARLDEILQRHFETVALGSGMGVPIVAGSDSGSYGVRHGIGLIDELMFHRRAGVAVDQVLASATSRPRSLWNCRAANIASGNEANLVVLEGSPFADFENLRRPVMTVRGTRALLCQGKQEARKLNEPKRAARAR